MGQDVSQVGPGSSFAVPDLMEQPLGTNYDQDQDEETGTKETRPKPETADVPSKPGKLGEFWSIVVQFLSARRQRKTMGERVGGSNSLHKATVGGLEGIKDLSTDQVVTRQGKWEHGPVSRNPEYGVRVVGILGHNSVERESCLLFAAKRWISSRMTLVPGSRYRVLWGQDKQRKSAWSA